MRITLNLSAERIEVYDFVEVSIKLDKKNIENPFTDVRLKGEFWQKDKEKSIKVEGFCDSSGGKLFKVRFMPEEIGDYKFKICYQQTDGFCKEFEGSFSAVTSQRKGVLNTDPDYPYHFIWQGTGEHYFLNGTTTYYLMGWQDDKTIEQIIDRLASYDINRLRVVLYGREFDRPWGTPVVNCEKFKMALNPWQAKFPDDITLPEYDMESFNVDYWQKYEKMLEYARQQDVIISVIFFIGAQPLCVPFAELSEEEYRYYRYGINRLAAYSNITWDVGNEHDFHRDTLWTRYMCYFIKRIDPYHHMVTAHNKIYRDNFIDMQLIQSWDAGLNDLILKEKEKLEEKNIKFPQVIEEFGYEDLWENMPGMRSADTRRRCAWEIYMAGGYQTTGESARNGTGTGKDTGGGWVSGRGDQEMTLLKSHKIMYQFFTSLDWWKLEPANDLVEAYYNYSFYDFKYYKQSGERVTDGHPFCLAREGETYLVYLPAGGNVRLKIKGGSYQIQRFNPRSGEKSPAGKLEGEKWTSPDLPDKEDWVFLLEKIN